MSPKSVRQPNGQEKNSEIRKRLLLMMAGGGLFLVLFWGLILWWVFLSGGPRDAGGPAIATTNVPDPDAAAETSESAEPDAANAGESPRVEGDSPAVPAFTNPSLDSFDFDTLMAINKPAVKLQQIANAFIQHGSRHRNLTMPRLQDQEEVDEGQESRYTQLSWRVHLLPYLQQKELYDKFHLDEPWDSEHNIALVNEMPDIYRVSETEESTTRFRVVTGEGALFGNAQAPQLRSIRDGRGNTMLALIVGVDQAVTWTQPDDFNVDPADPVTSLGRLPEGCVLCVTADMEPLPLHTSIPPEDFMALVTPTGNEVIDGETMRRSFQEDFRKLLAKKMQEEGKPSTRDVTQVAAPVAAYGRVNRMKRIVEAMLQYHSAYKQYPVALIRPENFDENEQTHLSWRVHLLPMLDHEPLYKQFKLDEPWDSPHNLSLVEKMPDVFRDPFDPLGDTKTRFLRLTGPETAFSKPHGVTMRSFRDGIANTLLVVSAGRDKAVPWTKPDDLAFDFQLPLECLGDLSAEQSITCAHADGAVSKLAPTIPPEMFKALVTPSGQERIPREFAKFRLQ